MAQGQAELAEIAAASDLRRSSPSPRKLAPAGEGGQATLASARAELMLVSMVANGGLQGPKGVGKARIGCSSILLDLQPI